MVLEDFFILKIPSLWAILIISFVITLVTTLVYKFTTNQKKMKKLKDEMKEYQNKIKALSKQDPQKAMALQQEAMKHNMEYMKHSFRSTLYTFIPIIIIFGWLNAHMAYSQLQPNQPFTVTAYFASGYASTANMTSIPELVFLTNSTQQIIDGKAIWKLQGDAGDYKLTLTYNNEAYDKSLIISSERSYAPPEQSISNSKLQKIVINNQKIYPFGDINFFGWKPNWLWAYIILSLLFSIGLRKVLNVY